VKKTREQPAQQAAAGQALRDFRNEQYATRARVSPDELLRAAQERGITITWESLRDIVDIRRGEAWITLTFITDFLSAYAATRHPKNVLDPWASIGSTLIRIVKDCQIPAATGISPLVTDIEVARIMTGDAPIEWAQGTPTAVLGTLGEYDLVVSSPPLGLSERVEPSLTSLVCA
jgi:hypothetical protein